MKITIEISDYDYERIKSYNYDVTDYQTTLRLYSAVKNGIVIDAQKESYETKQ